MILIREYTKYDIGAEGTLELQRGFLYAVDHHADVGLTPTELQDFKVRV